MIEVKNVKKKFIKNISKNKTKQFYANNGISFTAIDGEILGILGPNGAGKTTLLRIIAGIMKPNEGTVKIENMDYSSNDVKIKSQIAFLSGNTKLYKDLSPVEFLKMCGEYYDVSKDILNKRIDEIIKRFSMENFKDQRIGSLSTGQLQRTNLARCLVHNPKYYILDEATSGLDIISSKVILDFIKEERDNGKCILYSTHYMEEAENICDNVILMHQGKIIASNTPEKIKQKTNTSNLRDAFFSILEETNEN